MAEVHPEMILKLLDYLKCKIFSPIGERICSDSGVGQNETEEIACSFSVSEYLARIERASLEIAKNIEPVDKIIVLWWGLDGLRLNEDGTAEWISRRKPKPINQSVFYQPCQTIAPFPGYMCQSTQAMIDAVMAQETMNTFNARLQSQLQSYQVGYTGYYPSYFSGGIMTGYAHPRYLPQMQNCCCNRLI